jgi:hypothetical protein
LGAIKTNSLKRLAKIGLGYICLREDGICQAEYNTRECSWDGGDCCPAIVFGGLVLAILHTCGKPCSCVNTNGKENQKTKLKVKSNRKISRAKYRHMALSRYTFINSQPYFRRSL